MKKVLFLMSIALIACVSMAVISCSNEDETSVKNFISKKQAINNFKNDFFEFTASVKKAININNTKTRSGINDLENALSQEEEILLTEYIEQLDNSAINLFLSIGITEEDLQNLEELENPFIASIAAVETIRTLEQVIEDEEPEDPMEPEGRWVTVKEFIDYSVDCLLDACGISEEEIVPILIGGTAMTKESVRKTAITIIKNVGKRAGTGYIGATILVYRYGKCMIGKLS